MKIVIFFLSLTLLLNSCQKKRRDGRIEAAYIYRKANEHCYVIEPIEHITPPSYSWENRYVGKHFCISKEFFRCKGSSVHPLIIKEQVLADCNGGHSLPLREGKEHIYPLLIALLNYIQEKTEKEVVITTGHRCSKHNRYADQSTYNSASMHMIGAEVDFYVVGMEGKGEEIVELIKQYYLEDEEVKGDPDYRVFKRYTNKNVNVRIEPWYNQEIFVKIYQADEGRDFDNQHKHPYLSVQMRYDRHKREKVRFTHEEAERLLHESS